MIAQADLALNHRAVSETEVGRVVERISEPGHTTTPAAQGGTW
jgi:hypothetical protein